MTEAASPTPAESMARGYKALKDKHYHEAARHFELAVRAGIVEGQYELGQMFEIGLGVRKDSARARKLYESAARQNHILAAEQLAHFVAEGIGGDKNPDEGKKWQEKVQLWKTGKSELAAAVSAAAEKSETEKSEPSGSATEKPAAEKPAPENPAKDSGAAETTAEKANAESL